ncbi:hypothetical protein CYLTODRAFT_451324 [Cylindrobasidium torrendii FP15055 ss-10]|uniref:Uncharacterized protein n=1 Tax=Cylindrobasidium torrendii FP15055 ss-10 TaxID=1314674 RepID=A0A0D7BJX2_9AGAR|nr:hypothetical protein CYLTODRAFT_451324 [Cylindrobasidium torrendii FP15055 ss-10]
MSQAFSFTKEQCDRMFTAHLLEYGLQDDTINFGNSKMPRTFHSLAVPAPAGLKSACSGGTFLSSTGSDTDKSSPAASAFHSEAVSPATSTASANDVENATSSPTMHVSFLSSHLDSASHDSEPSTASTSPSATSIASSPPSSCSSLPAPSVRTKRRMSFDSAETGSTGQQKRLRVDHDEAAESVTATTSSDELNVQSPLNATPSSVEPALALSSSSPQVSVSSSTNALLATMPLPATTLPPSGSAVANLSTAAILAAIRPPVLAASSTVLSAAHFHEWTFIDKTAMLVTYGGELKPLNPPGAHRLCIAPLSSDGTTEAAIHQALVQALTDLADKEKSKPAVGEFLSLNVRQVLGSLSVVTRHVDDLKPLYPGATQTKPIEGEFLKGFATQLEVLQRYPKLSSRAYEQGQFSIVFHAVACPESYRTDVKTRRKIWRCAHCDEKFTGQPKYLREHFVEKGCDVLHALEATIAG